MPIQRRRLMSCFALTFAASGPARAADSDTILTLSGRLTRTNDGARHRLDDAALARLPQASMVVATPWFDAPRKFSGPLLRDVLATAGAQGERLVCSALNDYKVTIPFDDATRYDVVLARRIDDQPISVRKMGPLFVMYPFDRHPHLRSALYFGRCIWQLKTIEIA